MGIHDGHREKMRHRFCETGLEGFADHEALELLLYYAIPRRDTNELAHRLLARYGSLAALLQARCEKLTEIPEKVDFFEALPEYETDFFTNKKSKTNPEVSQSMLEAAIPMLEGLSDWTVDAIHDGLIDLAAKLEVKNATLMWPVRIAAAGRLVTPGGAVEICHILGQEETLRRLRLGLDKLK